MSAFDNNNPATVTVTVTVTVCIIPLPPWVFIEDNPLGTPPSPWVPLDDSDSDNDSDNGSNWSAATTPRHIESSSANCDW